MPLTAQELYDSCLHDEFPSIPVLVDYFGNSISSLPRQGVVLGVYQGLVECKGVTVELLDNCFRTNRLNELVHAKFKNKQSGYYRKFCELQIDLRNEAHLSDGEESRMEILDDDFCPNCLREGYITEEFGKGYIDCEKCLQLMCEHCYGRNGKCKRCCKKKKSE